MIRGSGAPSPIFRIQEVCRNRFVTTQNQWYDAWEDTTTEADAQCTAGNGETKTNVRLISLSIDQATNDEDLEIRIIADDIDETVTQAAVAGTNYFIIPDYNPDTAVFFAITSTLTADASQRRAFAFDARRLQIMYRKTSAAGANNTTVKVLYAQIP